MPVANNSGIHINYEITGDGPPLILQHGLTSKLDKWNWYGYVDELKRSYRVISVDARGHGKSDKPYDVSLYDRKIMASDIVSVMDRENIDMAHYMGYSMGGSIGFGLAEAFPQRFGEAEERRQENTSMPAQVVSGSSRSSPSSKGKVKLSQEDVRLAQKWNIPLETYASEKLKVNKAEGDYTDVYTN